MRNVIDCPVTALVEVQAAISVVAEHMEQVNQDADGVVLEMISERLGRIIEAIECSWADSIKTEFGG